MNYEKAYFKIPVTIPPPFENGGYCPRLPSADDKTHKPTSPHAASFGLREEALIITSLLYIYNATLFYPTSYGFTSASILPFCSLPMAPNKKNLRILRQGYLKNKKKH